MIIFFQSQPSLIILSRSPSQNSDQNYEKSVIIWRRNSNCLPKKPKIKVLESCPEKKLEIFHFLSALCIIQTIFFINADPEGFQLNDA